MTLGPTPWLDRPAFDAIDEKAEIQITHELAERRGDFQAATEL